MKAETTTTRPKPQNKKVALLGFGYPTSHKAPVMDPEWDIFALNNLYHKLPPLADIPGTGNLWFEIHTIDHVRDNMGIQHLPWLQACPWPVIQQVDYSEDINLRNKRDRIPTSEAFPVQEAADYFGKPIVTRKQEGYFTCSAAYMMALAIMMGYEEIGLWGMEFVLRKEADYERPAVEFYLGWAGGMDLKLHLPPDCSLLTSRVLYGFVDPWEGLINREALRKRGAALAKEGMKMQDLLAATDGRLQEIMRFNAIDKDKVLALVVKKTDQKLAAAAAKNKKRRAQCEDCGWKGPESDAVVVEIRIGCPKCRGVLWELHELKTDAFLVEVAKEAVDEALFENMELRTKQLISDREQESANLQTNYGQKAETDIWYTGLQQHARGYKGYDHDLFVLGAAEQMPDQRGGLNRVESDGQVDAELDRLEGKAPGDTKDGVIKDVGQIDAMELQEDLTEEDGITMTRETDDGATNDKRGAEEDV